MIPLKKFLLDVQLTYSWKYFLTTQGLKITDNNVIYYVIKVYLFPSIKLWLKYKTIQSETILN